MLQPQYWGVAAVDRGNASAAGGRARVPRVRLDDMVREDVLLLKIDCEGYEAIVLAGAAALLESRAVANVIVEVKDAAFRAELAATLAARGYACRKYREQYTPARATRARTTPTPTSPPRSAARLLRATTLR